MLIEFINSNRAALIGSTRAKVRKRLAPLPSEQELTTGVPIFLDHLVQMLRRPRSSDDANARDATRRGAELSSQGYTVAQVVHDYGDICQAITELAMHTGSPISTEEFHTLNLSLDNAIADAVTEYLRLREKSLLEGETERSGTFAHELRNKLSVAQLGFQMIKAGRAPVGGSVAAMVTRSLHGMIGLIDRALVEVRLDSGTLNRQRVNVRQLIEEAEVDALLEATVHGVSLSVAPVDASLDVEADPQILSGALANLLQNAFKFTRAGGRVSLTTRAAAGRVEIDIQDQCGGIPPEKASELFGAFQQRGTNREGLGLGLFISRKGVEASGGELRLRDVPGSGCVFTIDLPILPRAAA